MNKIIITLIIITALTLSHQLQAQVTKEYVTVVIYVDDYAISYPDGQKESGKIQLLSHRHEQLELCAKSINDIFNMLAKKGYKMFSSTWLPLSGPDYTTFYIFEK